MKKELMKAIKEGQPTIYINLINCGTEGKTMVKMLELAGYKPNNLGPQRFYVLTK
jgi:hypothetical protein